MENTIRTNAIANLSRIRESIKYPIENVLPNYQGSMVKSFQFDHENIAIVHLLKNVENPIHTFTAYSDHELYYRVIFILTPESCELHSINDHRQYLYADSRTMLMIPEEKKVQYVLHTEREVSILELLLSKKWILAYAQFHFPDSLTQDCIDSVTARIIVEPCFSTLLGIVNKLYSSVWEDHTDADKSARHLAGLLAHNLIRKAIQNNKPRFSSSEVHFQKILMVENILLDHLDKPLPSLPVIAQTVTLSESTLKRHFKNIFGKSVYEYYLEKKMAHAKKLLTDEPISVSETAERLGYEKVSNFIEIFKKHYGFSPGSIRKIHNLKLAD